jgi:hypothetical protein
MAAYETPTLNEVGSVRELTQQDQWALAFDGKLFHGDRQGGGYGS